MIAVLVGWAILLLVFLSFGEMAVWLWNKVARWDGYYTTTDKFWIGICVLGTLLLYFSIFCSLNIWALIATLCVSVIYWVVHRVHLKIYWGNIKKRIHEKSLSEKAILVSIFVAVLVYSLSTPLIYDEGLYHLQSMQWTEKYGAVLGLGNLHGRLAFNSSFLLLSTLFNYHPAYFDTFFTINSLSLLVFSFWIVGQIGKAKNILRSLALAIVLVTSLFTLGANVSSSSTDILPNILILYLLMRWVLEKDFLKTSPLLIILLAAFCITLKLSSAAILLSVVACIVCLWRNRERQLVGAVVLIGVVIAVPWLVRFVMMTGYLVYPFPSIDIFSVDWKIPIEMVTTEKDAAFAWARVPKLDTAEVLAMSIAEWLPIWAKGLSAYKLVLYMSAFASPLALLLWRRVEDKRLYVAWGIAFCGVVFGLFTAPDFRFGFGFIIAAMVLPLLIVDSKISYRAWKRIESPFYCAVLLTTLGLTYIAYTQVMTYQPLWDRETLSLLYKPQTVDLLQGANKGEFDEVKLNNTTIFVPKETDQCFDQSIPCMPYHLSNIEMRGNGIEDGFRIKQ